MVMDLELSDATLRVRERGECPGVIIAETLSELVEVSEVKLKLSESLSEGWRRAILQVPGLIYDKDLENFDEHKELLANRYVVNTPEESWVIIDVKDKALNDILKLRGIFQRIIEYKSTVGYEDFQIWIFPPEALKRISQALSEYADVYTISKQSKSIRELPSFKFDVKPRPVLSEEEVHILEVALSRGYFETPRPDDAKLEALARELDMGKGRLSERMRNIMRKMSREYFEKFVRPF